MRKNKDGSSYEGEYANDEAEGNGIYIYANGDVYKGQWHLGFLHGQGRKVTKLGAIFTGMFEQG
ncbi:MAG: hypothetical protein ACKO96_38920 [Flammeovirgaceae bacterium]